MLSHRITSLTRRDLQEPISDSPPLAAEDALVIADVLVGPSEPLELDHFIEVFRGSDEFIL